MFVLGITGNSGSGKSTVCEILKKNGAYVIDADKIAKQILEKGETAYNELINYFGSVTLPNGEIDRSTLSDIVFKDSEKLKTLNSITHKYVCQYMKEEIISVVKDNSYSIICLDVPLLFESGTDSMCHKTWLVDAPYEVKRGRISKRDNISLEKAELRLKSQTNSRQLRIQADDIIINTGSLTELESTVKAKLSEILMEGLAL